MKKNLCLLLLVCAFGTAEAQGLGVEFKKIDECSMLFLYNYQFCDEHKNPASVKSCEMLLEVGRRYSKFYLLNKAFFDSLLMLHANEPPETLVAKILPQIIGSFTHSFCDYYIFKNYPASGTTAFLASLVLAGSYRVEEKLELEWEIDNGAPMVILGLNCKKATCRFAGRSYEAWFTPDIPINDGPYKFSGLPGLIVKVQDSGNEHIFTLQEIKKGNNEAMYFPEKDYTATTAQGFTKALENSKIPMIEQMKSATQISGDPDAIPRAIARLQRQNNFIERY